MNTQNLQHAWAGLQGVVHHVLTSVVQVNWQALWLSFAVVALVALLQLCRVLPKTVYSRWRLCLLLTATLTPVLLCLWTWLSGYLKPAHYEAPYLWQAVYPHLRSLNPAPQGLSLSDIVEWSVIGAYGAWLFFYPAFVFLKSAPMRRLLKQHVENDPFWLNTAEWHWQRETWDDLLERFWFWRSIRIIEIPESAPMTAGFFRPVVVMPDGIAERTIGLQQPAPFRAVLAHELAHVRYHSLWLLIHRLAVWVFPLPQLPVWVFNCLRKRFQRLQMDTAQASSFIGSQAAAQMEVTRSLPMFARLSRTLERVVHSIPDPAALVDVEFELHADFVAVRRGGADPFVLKKTLLESLLFAAQAEEWARAVRRIEAHGDFERVLDKIRKSNGLFGAQHGRFTEFPQDSGVSLWAKLWKTAASLAVVHPLAIAVIPALVFLARAGSDLTSAPAPGFASSAARPSVVASASPRNNSDSVVAPPSRSPMATRVESSRRERRVASNPVPRDVSVPARATTGAPSIPDLPRTAVTPTPTQPASTSAQDAFQRVAAVNEQQRMLQANLSLQQRADASLQRQQADFNRNQQLLSSMNRNQSQVQTAERTRQTDANFTKANQQMQQTSARLDQIQSIQNSQLRQQSMMQNVDRASRINEQVTRQQTFLNNSRTPTTPYVPPTVVQPKSYSLPASYTYTSPTTVAQPRIYTPPMNTYTPPRVYNPPATFTPPRSYSPPPTPYIPPPPRIR